MLVEHGEDGVQRDISALPSPLPEPLIGRVGHDTIEPRAERAVSAKCLDLPDHGPERVLHDFLGILRATRDPDGEAEGAVSIGGDQTVRGGRFTVAESYHQRAIAVSACGAGVRAAPVYLEHCCRIAL